MFKAQHLPEEDHVITCLEPEGALTFKECSASLEQSDSVHSSTRIKAREAINAFLRAPRCECVLIACQDVDGEMLRGQKC